MPSVSRGHAHSYLCSHHAPRLLFSEGQEAGRETFRLIRECVELLTCKRQTTWTWINRAREPELSVGCWKQFSVFHFCRRWAAFCLSSHLLRMPPGSPALVSGSFNTLSAVGIEFHMPYDNVLFTFFGSFSLLLLCSENGLLHLKKEKKLFLSSSSHKTKQTKKKLKTRIWK